MEDRLDDSREKRDHDKLPDHCVCLFISTFLFLPSFLHIDSLSLMLFHDWTRLVDRLTQEMDNLSTNPFHRPISLSPSLSLSVLFVRSESFVYRTKRGAWEDKQPISWLSPTTAAQRSPKEPQGAYRRRLVQDRLADSRSRQTSLRRRKNGWERGKEVKKNKTKTKANKKRWWNIDREQTLHC